MAVLNPNSPAASPVQFLDAKAAARRYGISDRHWIRLVSAGKAPVPTRFGRLVRWNVEELKAWESNGCPAMEGERK